MAGASSAGRGVRLAIALLLATAPAGALAGDGKKADVYPPGESSQVFDGRKFDIRVPVGEAPARKFSLILSINTPFNELGDATALVKDGFVICLPYPKGKSGGWATSEASDLVALVDHLAASLPLARERVHIATTQDTFGFATFVAFEKNCQPASLAILNTVSYRGKNPPEGARKRLAVLSLWSDGDAPHGNGSDIVARLEGKVHTVEHRVEATAQPYFRYWLHVADDRFTPGWDLSLDWLYDAIPVKPRAGETAAPPIVPALDRAKTAAAAGKRGALVYFWSAGDAAKPEAKALQNELLFRADVRALAGRTIPVKLERERAEKEFAGFGLKTTPALVVLDAAFAPVKTFEGIVDEKGFLEALKKVAGPEPKEKDKGK